MDMWQERGQALTHLGPKSGMGEEERGEKEKEGI